MSIAFGPFKTSIKPTAASDVTVTTWDGRPVTLASPVALNQDNYVSFAVNEPGRYKITVTVYPGVSNDTVDITNVPPYDTTSFKSYVNFVVSQSFEGGGSSGGVSPAELNTAIADYLETNAISQSQITGLETDLQTISDDVSGITTSLNTTMRVVVYNTTTSSWPSRPSGVANGLVTYNSSHASSAAAPTDPLSADIWVKVIP